MAENSGELRSRPQFEVPEPSEEGLERQQERALEKGQPEEATPGKQSPKSTSSASSPVSIPIQTPVPTPVTDDSARPASSTDNTGAPNRDLIEKQWVERAKSIVAQTQDDPYKQKNEMSKVKADYIKKRFNKTIPADDALAL